MRRLLRAVETVMHDRSGANARLALMLHGISHGYSMAVRTRVRLFRQQRLVSQRLPCKIVSVGNITLGGTGKTPMSIYLAQLIKKAGYRVAVVSRGYKGQAEKTGGIVSDGRALQMRPSAAGDEPYLMAQKLLPMGIPVLVGQDRVRSGHLALRRFAVEVIVLDDGFQHLRLQRDLDIVLLDAAKPVGNGFLLPRGTLREPLAALSRADMVLLTRCPQEIVANRQTDHFQARVTAAATPERCPVFPVAHTPFMVECVPVSTHARRATQMGLEAPMRRPVYAFSGIARNSAFRRTLVDMGYDLLGWQAFGDHHRYSANAIDAIGARAQRKGAQLLVTTEKDRVKIADAWIRHLPLLVVGIRMDFGVYTEAFEQFVIRKLESADNVASVGH